MCGIEILLVHLRYSLCISDAVSAFAMPSLNLYNISLFERLVFYKIKCHNLGKYLCL
jgi:hypothetical protein